MVWLDIRMDGWTDRGNACCPSHCHGGGGGELKGELLFHCLPFIASNLILKNCLKYYIPELRSQLGWE